MTTTAENIAIAKCSCGAEPEVRTHHLDDEVAGFGVVCTHCLMEGPASATEYRAIQEWNKAAAAPDLLAALKEWVKFFDDLNRYADPNDPLVKARNHYHAARVERSRKAIALAEGKQS